MLQCSMGETMMELAAAFKDFDRTFERPQLAMCEPRELGAQGRAAGDPRVQLIAALLGEPQRETPAIVRILRPLDETGTHQGIDRPADRRRSPPQGLGDMVERRRLIASDGREQFAARPIGALRWSF